ncbi:extracellular solute-binding protein [Cyanobium gracile]|uniref:Extracellular solute-binding protein n=1 Tax=Cyanobium gracile UHCC 0281 TaxID=3110309 RepID=A0ABU5SYK2_9CYAN|nr:extracellular solute-binding protein [Cyanobium gracile]MEA5443405.1 extracellular solute-binding protein [Cyanobium gracile UHCC 0281]
MAIPLVVSLGGCQPNRTRPVLRPLGGTLYIAVGVSQDDIDFELQKEVRQRTAELQATFRALQPKVRLQVQVFAEQSLRNELRIRNRTGLSPDLLLVNQATARELASDRLISTVRVPAVVLDQLDPGSVQRVRRQDGSLIGIPMELQPQVACFDRRRIKRSPANLDELLAFSAKGMEVGFSLDAMNLAWTLGPLGAINAVSDLLAGEPATPMSRQSLNGWLQWLRQADGQQHVTVFPSETELLKALIGGSLDWIPCRSINITRLRSRLGQNLGVAALPSGPFGEASPITRERVLSFGVNSSPEQRQLALALARFAVSPLHQRDLVLRNKYVLPVNLEIAPPVQSSSVVAAMVEGRDQSLRSATTRLDQGSSESQREGWQALLTRYLFDDLSQKDALEGLITLLSGGRQR